MSEAGALAAQRRSEARRRRILQNAGNRLDYLRGEKLSSKFDAEVKDADEIAENCSELPSSHEPELEPEAEQKTESVLPKNSSPPMYYTLNPVVQVLLPFLTGLTYHLVKDHGDLLASAGIRPAWFGKSVTYGFLVIYIPAILLARFTPMATRHTSLGWAKNVAFYVLYLLGTPTSVTLVLIRITIFLYQLLSGLMVTLCVYFLLHGLDN